MEQQLKVYKYAATIGAGFLGTAYELLFHCAVRDAVVKKTKPVVLKVKPGGDYNIITLDVDHVMCYGKCAQDCSHFLACSFGKRIYWHPDYPLFPFIDVVTTCHAFRPGSQHPETILAYIQVTIKIEKTFDQARLDALNHVIDQNPSFVTEPPKRPSRKSTPAPPTMKRVFVVVTPDESTCAAFKLHNAPEPAVCLTVVGYFDPVELEEQQRPFVGIRSIHHETKRASDDS